jgi:hypothetical protein
VAGRARTKHWQARFALGSLLLHAALFGLAFTRARQPSQASNVTTPTELEIDVVPAAVDVAPSEERGGGEPAPSQASRAARAGVSVHNAAAVAEAEAEVATSDAGEGEAPGDTAAAPSTASSAAAPHLSLAELGVDGNNPFLERAYPIAARAAKAARVKRRLDQALAQGLTDQDVERGRGAGSPVVRSLEAAVYASSAPLNGNASFTLIIDSEGKLVSSTLGAASGDRQAWVRVAHQTAQALAQRKLPVPKGRSVRLTVQVTSHLELPSGRDPGVEVRALGIPLKRGGGERSTRLDILNPLHPTAPLVLDGDPADIGAQARRMVHAHVVSEELL